MEVGPGSSHPDRGDFNLGGLAVLDGKLYVASRDKAAVFVLDAETGEPVNNAMLALNANDPDKLAKAYSLWKKGPITPNLREAIIASSQGDIDRAAELLG